MFRLIDTALMTERQQTAVLLIYGLSCPYRLIDEQPYLSKRLWQNRFKISGKTARSLAKRKFLEYDENGGIRLTIDAWRLVEKAK